MAGCCLFHTFLLDLKLASSACLTCDLQVSKERGTDSPILGGYALRIGCVYASNRKIRIRLVLQDEVSVPALATFLSPCRGQEPCLNEDNSVTLTFFIPPFIKSS